MCQAAPAAWDAFSLELWGMLTTGGTVVIVPDDHLLPHVLQHHIVDDGVNTAWLTASLFNLFVDLEPDCFKGLSHLLSGGERLSPAHVGEFLARHPEVRLTNGYGPVESCVFATCHRVTPADVTRPDGIPLGRPVPQTGVHLEDGEILISGAGLALGYLGDPELTAARFAGGRYRTGDRGVLDDDGLLHFRGRVDRQVKIRGHRIEPAEIEAAAGGLAGVRSCAVVPVPGAAGGFDRLALFFVGSVAAPEVRRRLRAVLPPYAIPDTVRQVDAMPVTANGKADERALLTSFQQTQ
jgi:non-ribosomal peptide synthetase component F